MGNEQAKVIGAVGIPKCYRRSNIDLKACVRGDQQAWALPYDTWVKVKSVETHLKSPARLAGDQGHHLCSHLFGDNCTANDMCRWCQINEPGHTPPHYRSCVSKAFADGFRGDNAQCEVPKPDPCQAHTSYQDCRSNGCRYCHPAGSPGASECRSEVMEDGWCDDTSNHEAAYKTCAQLDGVGSVPSGCDTTAVCAKCRIQVWQNVSSSAYTEVCVDKDDVDSCESSVKAFLI